MTDTHPLCRRCSRLSLDARGFIAVSFQSRRSCSYTLKNVHREIWNPLPIGAPKDWDPSCSLCRVLARLAVVTGTQDSFDWSAYTGYSLCSVDAVSALDGLVNLEIQQRPAYPVALIVLPTDEVERDRWDVRGRRRLQPIPTDASEEPYTLRQRNAMANIALIRKWLTDCISNHEQCRSNTALSCPGMKLIECSTGCLTAYQANMSYLALSYVWSEVDSDLDCPAETPGVMRSTLLRTVLRLALDLGYQFVWIDRYCIDQDDEKHKMQQIGCMGEIYAGADMTIVAADHVTGSRYGLSGVISRQELPIHTIASARCRLMPPAPFYSIRHSVWNSRAWTYQESMLSRRRLFVLPDEVYFECSRSSYSELLHGELRSALWGTTNYHGSGALADLGLQDQGLTHVYTHVNWFCERNLTFPADILDAFEGILGQLARLYTHLRFLTGLPIEVEPSVSPGSVHSPGSSLLHWPHESRPPENKPIFEVALVCALCWRSMGIERRRRPEFPSWTWAGWYRAEPTTGGLFFDTPKLVSSVDLRLHDFLRNGQPVHLRAHSLHLECPVIRIKAASSKNLTLEHCSALGKASIESRGSYCGNDRSSQDDFCLHYERLGEALHFLALYQAVEVDWISLSGLLAFELSPGCFERLDFATFRLRDRQTGVAEAINKKLTVELV